MLSLASAGNISIQWPEVSRTKFSLIGRLSCFSCIAFVHFVFSLFTPIFRPLSKTVRFNVLKVIPAGSSGGGKKAFTGI